MQLSRISCRQGLGGRFQARQVFDVKELGGLVDALQKAAQGLAGPQLNETSETLPDQITHGILPAHRRGDLLDQSHPNRTRAAVRLRSYVRYDGDDWRSQSHASQFSL